MKEFIQSAFKKDTVSEMIQNYYLKLKMSLACNNILLLQVWLNGLK